MEYPKQKKEFMTLEDGNNRGISTLEAKQLSKSDLDIDSPSL